MKLFFLGLILTSATWAKPLILVSYYDAFGMAPFNNSERVAEAIAAQLNQGSSPVRIKLCQLETKFDVAYANLEKCIREEKPDMILGLGETGCNLKIELVARNLDKTKGADNAGVERKNTVIIPDAPSHLGLSYPLDKMFCSLSAKDRRNVFVSNDAGSFVCNNTAFQLSYHYEDIPNGFIHVPSHNCRDLDSLNAETIRKLGTMVASLGESEITSERLPVTKEEVQSKRMSAKGDECRSDFYGRLKGLKRR